MMSLRIASFLVILLAQTFVWAADADLHIGFLLGGNPEASKKQAVYFAEKIQESTGKTVEVFFPKDYQGLVEAFKNEKVDLALFTAMTYVLAEKQTAMKTLLKKTWEGPYYYSSLVTLKKNKITKISQLKGKTIAFVDPKSTSGFLYPQVFLRKNKLTDKDFAKVIYTGNHAASIKALENGEVDVVAVFSDDEKGKIGAWTRFSDKPISDFNILWTSEPIPNDPIVVRQSFYDKNSKFVHDLMVDMIQIQSENSKNLFEILGKGRLIPATSKQYDPVREMVRALEKEISL